MKKVIFIITQTDFYRREFDRKCFIILFLDLSYNNHSMFGLQRCLWNIVIATQLRELVKKKVRSTLITKIINIPITDIQLINIYNDQILSFNVSGPFK